MQNPPIESTQNFLSKPAPVSRRTQSASVVHHEQPSPLKLYLINLPTLFLGLLFYSLLFFTFRYIEPETIRDMVMRQSYFPVLVFSFGGHFFFFSYLLINLRRGFLLAAWLTLALGLRLQHQHAPVLLLVTASLILVIESCLILFKTRR